MNTRKGPVKRSTGTRGRPKAAAKKPATRKPAAKKAARKPATRKPAAKKAGAQRAGARKTAPVKSLVRRPDPGLQPNFNTIRNITTELKNLIDDIDSYIVNMRALDRKRHNGVGVRRLGFIDAAFRISSNFPQYFPHWLDTEKFRKDMNLFTAIQGLVEVCRALEEKIWNMHVEAADMAYTDALEYYSPVKDAAERRIDGAEKIYAELHSFFGNMGPHGTEDQPTEKKLKHDVDALMHGRKDGEIIIRNVKPKMTGGKHEVIDETFNDSASFKESEHGGFKE